MNRDIRDPSEIGAALAAQRARSPETPIAKIADDVLHGTYIRNYGETNAELADRISKADGYQRKLFSINGGNSELAA